jgi:exoribonuclease-2
MSANHFDLAAAAFTEMVRQGFHPDFPNGTEEQVDRIRAAGAEAPNGEVRDLRGLIWSSIDNDTSRDLDQIEYAERVAGGIRVLVGVADVSRSVEKGSPIDRHAADQTKTVYTGVRNFPMLPNELSTDMTSLNQDVDRAAMVIEFVVDVRGCLREQSIYRAVVHNRAQLAYSKAGRGGSGICWSSRRISGFSTAVPNHHQRTMGRASAGGFLKPCSRDGAGWTAVAGDWARLEEQSRPRSETV